MTGTDGWDWPESLDAVVAAPEHHSVLLENDRVRVLETRVEPGDTVPVHTHRWPSVQYIVELAAFVRRDADGNVLLDTRTTDQPGAVPRAQWSGPLSPHTFENVGDGPIDVIMIELKDRPRD
jgi:hypothetical protein